MSRLRYNRRDAGDHLKNRCPELGRLMEDSGPLKLKVAKNTDLFNALLDWCNEGIKWMQDKNPLITNVKLKLKSTIPKAMVAGVEENPAKRLPRQGSVGDHRQQRLRRRRQPHPASRARS